MPLYKQPIVHFLILGLLFFAAYHWLNPGETASDDNRIILDQQSLLEHLQYRQRAFNAGTAATKLAALSTAELTGLKTQLIREEALYREALKLGMEQNDYVIKQRLIQKIEYLAQGFQEQNTPVPAEAVIAYFRQHKQRYAEPPTFTFTHVFVDAHNGDDSLKQADALLATLRQNKVPFSDATRYGDRFLYHVNYVERPYDFIASHFGTGFAQRLATLKPANGEWYGPIPSSHGLHLVMITRHNPGGIPPLEQIHDRVAQDARQALILEQTDQALQRIIDSYTVVDNTVKPGSGYDAESK